MNRFNFYLKTFALLLLARKTLVIYVEKVAQ